MRRAWGVVCARCMGRGAWCLAPVVRHVFSGVSCVPTTGGQFAARTRSSPRPKQVIIGDGDESEDVVIKVGSVLFGSGIVITTLVHDDNYDDMMIMMI